MRNTPLHRRITLATVIINWVMFLVTGCAITDWVDARQSGRPFVLAPWIVQICQGAIASGLFVLGMGAAAEIKNGSEKHKDDP